MPWANDHDRLDEMRRRTHVVIVARIDRRRPLSARGAAGQHQTLGRVLGPFAPRGCRVARGAAARDGGLLASGLAGGPHTHARVVRPPAVSNGVSPGARSRCPGPRGRHRPGRAGARVRPARARGVARSLRARESRVLQSGSAGRDRRALAGVGHRVPWSALSGSRGRRNRRPAVLGGTVVLRSGDSADAETSETVRSDLRARTLGASGAQAKFLYQHKTRGLWSPT